MTARPGQTPQRPDERQAPRYTVVHAFALLTAVIGASMILRALLAGGGLGSYGVLIGALFLAAGLMRLRVLSSRTKR